jgi:hypothetical protein
MMEKIRYLCSNEKSRDFSAKDSQHFTVQERQLYSEVIDMSADDVKRVKNEALAVDAELSASIPLSERR